MQIGDVKVSVVIPVYNGETYLSECLDSVIGQTLKEIEVICVDDGSTDSSVNIIKSYIEKDRRIQLVQQKNQYAGIARNNGMKYAKGKYLVFWDSDDFFDKRALELMSKKMDEDRADICVCDALQYDTIRHEKFRGPRYLNLKYLPRKTPFCWKDIPDRIFNFTTDVPWNKMYSREFVEKNGLQFQGIVRANDHYFVLSAAMAAERITYIDDSLIFYRVSHDTSLTASLSASPLCTYEAFLAAKESMVKYGLWDVEEARRSFANRCLNSLIFVLDKQCSFESFDIIYQKLMNEGFEVLGIVDKGENYYHSAESYRILKQMLENSSTDFLILHFQDYYKKSKELEKKLKKGKNSVLYEKARKLYHLLRYRKA